MSGQGTQSNLFTDLLFERVSAFAAQWSDAIVLLQIVILLCVLAIGWVGGRIVARSLQTWLAAFARHELSQRIADALCALAVPAACSLLLMAAVATLSAADLDAGLLSLVLSVLSTWMLLRFVASLVASPIVARALVWLGWPLASLVVLGWLDPLIKLMGEMAIPFAGSHSDGSPRLTLLDVLRSALFLVLLFWIAGVAGQFLRERIESASTLTPITRALAVKVLGVAMPLLAVLIALQIAGFDLAALAVFSGAAGLGVGLGLQRIVANYVAGFTLVADRSIKPGDVIEIDQTFGWVTSMHGRYVALRTRDGTERLVPNERFMSEGVVNWSRTDKVVRVHAPFGVSYATADLRAVQALAIGVARGTPRVVTQPPPVCLLKAFGESSIDFDLRFWIEDPEAGLANIRSEILVRLWEQLRSAGVEIPFPQRDLHIRSWPAGSDERLPDRSESTGNPPA